MIVCFNRACSLDRLANFVLPCLPSVRPFASDEEFKNTFDIVKKFQQGVGKDLHQKLQQRARTKRNWVCDWAEMSRFWCYRCLFFFAECFVFLLPAGRMVVRHSLSGDSHPLSAERKLWRPSALPGALLASCRGNFSSEGQYYHMAFTTVLEHDPHVRLVYTQHKLCVCGVLSWVCSSFLHEVKCGFSVLSLACFRERLPPQKAGKTALDMEQFRMLFCTCKVPGVKKDTIRNYFKTGRSNSAFISNLQTHLCAL